MDIKKEELKDILNECINKINSEKGEVKIPLSTYQDLLYYKKQYEKYCNKIDKIDRIVCRILEQDCNISEYPYNNIMDIRKIMCE